MYSKFKMSTVMISNEKHIAPIKIKKLTFAYTLSVSVIVNLAIHRISAQQILEEWPPENIAIR